MAKSATHVPLGTFTARARGCQRPLFLPTVTGTSVPHCPMQPPVYHLIAQSPLLLGDLSFNVKSLSPFDCRFPRARTPLSVLPLIN